MKEAIFAVDRIVMVVFHGGEMDGIIRKFYDWPQK